MADEVDESHSGQPLPQPTTGPSMHFLVIQDMEARKEFGLKKYGTLLQAKNGRDALKDLYEELLDAIVYVRQVIEEDRLDREMFERSPSPNFYDMPHVVDAMANFIRDNFSFTDFEWNRTMARKMLQALEDVL